MAIVELYTDGACRGNPGVGGWGVVMRYNGHEKELYGAEAETTNNRMELQAAIAGLRALTRACRVQLTTDSKYVRDGVTQWLARWQQNGWKTANRKPVKNQDLWEQLAVEIGRHEISWEWVKGHSGHPENERADGLANRAIDELLD